MKMTQQQVQDARYAFKADLEAIGLTLGDLDTDWSEFDFSDGFVFADDHACWCMGWHHYHSTKDGGILQVG